MSLWIKVQARKASQRVPNKLLRPFAGTCLFDLCLDKLEHEDLKPRTIIAVGDDEMITKAHERGFQVALRDEHSLNGEASEQIDQYLFHLKQDVTHFVDVDACHPLLTTDTILAFAEEREKLIGMGLGDLGSLAVVRQPSWHFYGPEIAARIVNEDAALGNTKLMQPVWRSANALYGYQLSYYLKNWVYWPLTPGNPRMFPIPEMEATDVDTMEDFEYAEWRYLRCHG